MSLDSVDQTDLGLSAPASLVFHYLQGLPGFDRDDEIDTVFARELVNDFSDIDVLEQIKAFRWYHDGRPARANPKLRLAIRRWLSRARPTEPF